MKLLFISLTLGCFATASQAAPPRDLPGLRNVLAQLQVDAEPEELAPAPIPGYLEIVRGAQVLYVSRDGGILINGDILSVATATNLTETRRSQVRLELLSGLPEDQRMIVPAEGTRQASLVVFTDTHCPYCQRLHQQLAKLPHDGIEVQYLFYPRSGPSSESFAQAVAVWCSRDRLAALDAVFGGATLPAASCEHPVMAQYDLALRLDLKGTPAILTADGAVHYGALGTQEIVDAVRHPGQE